MKNLDEKLLEYFTNKKLSEIKYFTKSLPKEEQEKLLDKIFEAHKTQNFDPLKVTLRFWPKERKKDLLNDNKLLNKQERLDKDMLQILSKEYYAQQINELETKIKAGANLHSIKDKYGRAAFNIAFSKENTELMKFLIQKKVECHETYPNHGSLNVLQIAAKNGDIELVKIVHDKFKLSYKGALHLTIQNKHPKALELLLKLGANPNDTYKGSLPLHEAFSLLENNNDDYNKIASNNIINILLEANASVNNCVNAQSPLHLAAKYPDAYFIARNLIDNGASLLRKDADGMTPIHVAAKYGNIAFLEDIVPGQSNGLFSFITNKLGKHHKALNKQDIDGNTAAHLLIKYMANKEPNYKTLEIFKKIISHMDDIDQKNHCGQTILFEASANNLPLEAIEAIFEHKANPNIVDNSGHGCLSVLNRYPDLTQKKLAPSIAKLLIEHKANPNIVDNFGQKANYYIDDIETITLLFKHGLTLEKSDAFANDRDLSTTHPLVTFSSIQLSNTDMFIKLLKLYTDYGFNINEQDKNGNSFAHHLAIRNDEYSELNNHDKRELSKYLIENHKADYELCNHTGLKPLDYSNNQSLKDLYNKTLEPIGDLDGDFDYDYYLVQE
ncbi:MAG: hypothetical protein DGJ47_000710 [Rickettsiaceae bacterium]